MKDTIYRQVAIDALTEANLKSHMDSVEGGQENRSAIRIIMALPSAERKGHWIEKEDPYGFFNSIPVCSECGCTTKMRERYNFCPNCGVRMVSEDE